MHKHLSLRFVLISCVACMMLLLSACGPNARYYSDYDTMWHYIETEYPLLHVAERVTGKDFAVIKKDYRKKIDGISSDKAFFNEIIQPCLDEFEFTGHMTAVDRDQYLSLHAALIAARGSEFEDTKIDYLLEVLDSPDVVAFYEALNAGPFSSAPLPYKAAVCDERAPNLGFRHYPEYSAAYLSVKVMAPVWEKAGPKIADFFAKSETENYQHCIIDIRGNGGGSDGFWMINLAQPNLSQYTEWSSYGLVKGPDTQKYLELDGSQLIPISKMPTEQFININPVDLNEAHYYSFGTNFFTPTSNTPLFSGKFWVLVDDGVYSSAESFSRFCQATGFATLIGTQTNGDGGGVTPLIISLPHTGICFQFSAENNLNADGSSSEEYGTTPDIVIAEGKDALERCFKEIEHYNAK